MVITAIVMAQLVTLLRFVTPSVAICDKCLNLRRKLSQFVKTSKHAFSRHTYIDSICTYIYIVHSNYVDE